MKKNKLDNILENFTQRHIRREHAMFDMSEDDCDNDFQFLQMTTQFIMI